MLIKSGTAPYGVLVTALCALLLNSALAEQRPLRLLGAIYLGDLPTLIADQKGLFRQQGLEVDVSLGFSGRENLQGLLAGDADFALMAPTPFVLHQLQADRTEDANDPIILASLVHATRLEALMVRDDSDIRQPADLLGRRVALMGGTNAEYLWWLFCQFHDLDQDRITVVEATNHTAGTLLTSGEVDAAVIWQPWSQLAAEAADVPLRILSVGEGYTAKWLLVGRRDVVRQQSEATIQLLRAYMKALDLIEEQPDASLTRYADHAGLSRSTATPERLPVFGLSLDWSLLADLQQHLEWARAQGKDGAELPPDIISWIEPGPLLSINPAAVSLPGARNR